ncbi:DUF397 domain-containing protein [Nocardia sp. NPDC020380]|uniref:DUF397 domain-containing protein n=1 Tax=Nocardia sp. NPDC020380 TaxID=3364309 RepID=UPI0037BA0E8E
MVTGWFKSSFSGAEKTCVEVAYRGDVIQVRDSKYLGSAVDQPIISVPFVLWPMVLDLVLSSSKGDVSGELTISLNADGGATIRDRQGVELLFTVEEWQAFAKGIAAGEFSGDGGRSLSLETAL